MGHRKIFEKSRTVSKKNQKGLVSAGFVGYVKKVKNEKRDPLETEKISKKVAQCRKKNRKGRLFSPVRFVGYLEKVKNERGDPLH